MNMKTRTILILSVLLFCTNGARAEGDMSFINKSTMEFTASAYAYVTFCKRYKINELAIIGMFEEFGDHALYNDKEFRRLLARNLNALKVIDDNDSNGVCHLAKEFFGPNGSLRKNLLIKR